MTLLPRSLGQANLHFSDRSIPPPGEEERDQILRRAARLRSGRPDAGPIDSWLFERLASTSIRVERLESLEADRRGYVAGRSSVLWEFERKAEVEELALGLAGDPVRVFGGLRSSHFGVLWLIERWKVLLAPLAEGKPWTEADRSRGLDLLGIPLDVRSLPVPVDFAGDEAEVGRARRDFVEAKLKELGVLVGRDSFLLKLEHEACRIAVAGLAARPDPVLDALRKEIDASYRRMRWILSTLKSGAGTGRSRTSPALEPAGPLTDPARRDRGEDRPAAPTPEQVDDAFGRFTPEERARLDRILSDPGPLEEDFGDSPTGRPDCDEARAVEPRFPHRASRRPLNRHQRRAFEALGRKG